MGTVSITRSPTAREIQALRSFCQRPAASQSHPAVTCLDAPIRDGTACPASAVGWHSLTQRHHARGHRVTRFGFPVGGPQQTRLTERLSMDGGVPLAVRTSVNTDGQPILPFLANRVRDFPTVALVRDLVERPAGATQQDAPGDASNAETVVHGRHPAHHDPEPRRTIPSNLLPTDVISRTAPVQPSPKAARLLPSSGERDPTNTPRMALASASIG